MIYNWIANFFHAVERLNFHQYALLVIVIVVVGFVCLRGYGSRSNY